MKLNFLLLHTKTVGTLGTAGTASIHAGLRVPNQFVEVGDNGDKLKIVPDVPKVFPSANHLQSQHLCGVPNVPSVPAEKTAREGQAIETSRCWLVDTSDRGTIRVTCYPPHTLDEILDAVPEAVSAIPIRE